MSNINAFLQSTNSTLLTPEIVQLLAQIHEHKGEHAKVQEDELTHLIEIARIQSTEASALWRSISCRM